MATKTLPEMIRSAETGEQWAAICLAEKMAVDRGYTAKDITAVHFDDAGNVGSVELGTDEDGMGRFVLNFAL